MTNEMFQTLLPVIVTALTDKVMSSGLSEDGAIERLYDSELYAALENEETKVWHYSVPMLYELYQNEITTGHLTLPEY